MDLSVYDYSIYSRNKKIAPPISRSNCPSPPKKNRSKAALSSNSSISKNCKASKDDFERVDDISRLLSLGNTNSDKITNFRSQKEQSQGYSRRSYSVKEKSFKSGQKLKDYAILDDIDENSTKILHSKPRPSADKSCIHRSLQSSPNKVINDHTNRNSNTELILLSPTESKSLDSSIVSPLKIISENVHNSTICDRLKESNEKNNKNSFGSKLKIQVINETKISSEISESESGTPCNPITTLRTALNDSLRVYNIKGF